MIRETEYRAWYYDKDYPEFSHMTFVCSIDFVKRKAKIGVLENVYKFDQIELMQYTGLKDKNGVKIFEGDIVMDEIERKFIIEYKFGGFNVVPIGYYNDEFSWNPLGDMQCAGWLTESCEIIGNIYKNKELLENAEK